MCSALSSAHFLCCCCSGEVRLAWLTMLESEGDLNSATRAGQASSLPSGTPDTGWRNNGSANRDRFDACRGLWYLSSYVQETFLVERQEVLFRWELNFETYINFRPVGWATSKEVSRLSVTAEVRILSLFSPCGVCSGHRFTGTGFSPHTSVFLQSLQYNHRLVLICILILLLSEGQTGGTWNKQTKQRLFGNRKTLDTRYFHVKLLGRAFGQAVCRRVLTAETWVQFEARPGEICGAQSDTGTGSSSPKSGFSSQYHSTNAPHSSASIWYCHQKDKWAKPEKKKGCFGYRRLWIEFLHRLDQTDATCPNTCRVSLTPLLPSVPLAHSCSTLRHFTGGAPGLCW